MKKRLYVSKKQPNIAILTTIGVILAFMQFAPWGRFNPAKVGFWVSLVGALTGILIDYSIAKYRVKE